MDLIYCRPTEFEGVKIPFCSCNAIFYWLSSGASEVHIVTATTSAYYCYCLAVGRTLIRVCGNQLKESHSLTFPLRSLLFHTIRSKSYYCHTALPTFSLISHHCSLFSPHTQTHHQLAHPYIWLITWDPSAHQHTSTHTKPNKVRNLLPSTGFAGAQAYLKLATQQC